MPSTRMRVKAAAAASSPSSSTLPSSRRTRSTPKKAAPTPKDPTPPPSPPPMVEDAPSPDLDDPMDLSEEDETANLTSVPLIASMSRGSHKVSHLPPTLSATSNTTPDPDEEIVLDAYPGRITLSSGHAPGKPLFRSEDEYMHSLYASFDNPIPPPSESSREGSVDPSVSTTRTPRESRAERFINGLLSPTYNLLRRAGYGIANTTWSQETAMDTSDADTSADSEYMDLDIPEDGIDLSWDLPPHPALCPEAIPLPESISLDADVEAEVTEEAALEYDFESYLLLANPPPIPEEYRIRPNALPPKTRSAKKITLVLDLDETLVHCSTSPLPRATLHFPVTHEDRHFAVNGNIRPYAEAFLHRCAELFEVVIFTASQRAYADQLLDILDPTGKCIKHRLFRDSCVYAEGNYLKDLRILGRDLSRVIIIDNAPQAFSYQVDNGIPIQSWYDDAEDTHLPNILTFLESIVDAEDVRPYLDEAFRVRERVRVAQERLLCI